MASDIHVLDWMGEFFGSESYKQRMLDWLQRTFSGEEDIPLNREVLEVAHLFVVFGVGWNDACSPNSWLSMT